MFLFLLALLSTSTALGVGRTMEPLSQISYIENEPEDPVELFSHLLEQLKTTNPAQQFVQMNIATIDREFGPLGRTVVYRGLTDNHVTFVTETNTRKYSNLMENPMVSVTFQLGKIIDSDGEEAIWQVRIFGNATELSDIQKSNLWNEEAVFAKIRSRIAECGKPIDHEQFRLAHDDLLRKYESGEDTLPQTPSYTAFKIIPKVWDFYKTGLSNCIADRVQYRKSSCHEGQWDIMHVAP